MTRMITNPGTASLCIVLLSVTSASAGEMFFDEATVVDSQPVYETRRIPEQVQRCGHEEGWTAAQVNPALLGDARSTSANDDIVVALRSESSLRGSRQSTYRCRMVTQTAERRELSGYRVRFRYEGRIYERHMAEDPGELIRVRVRVSAGEHHLLTRSTGEPTFTTRSAAW